MSQADFGLVGLAVMGENLVLNVESRGYTCAVYNRTTSKVDNFINGRAKGKNFIGCYSPEELCQNLKQIRQLPFTDLVKFEAELSDVDRFLGNACDSL